MNRAPRTDELAGRVRLQLGFRLVIATALLVVTGLLHASGRYFFSPDYSFGPLYATIFVLFLAVLVAALLWRRTRTVEGLHRLAAAQVVSDVVTTTALVYVSGGADSPFTFIFALHVLNSALVLLRRGVFIAAGSSAIAYGLLLTLTHYGVIPPYSPDLGGSASATQLLLRIVVATVGFLLTGVLASYLAELLRQTREELREQRVDLRKLQALNKLIVENISSGLLTVDRSRRVSSMNPFAEDVLGVGLGEVYEKPVDVLFPDANSFLADLDSSESERDEVHYQRPDGREVILGFSSSPLRDDAGETIGRIIVFRDLTDLRDLEARVKRDERLAAVGRLAAGIAHEIRNPLASISGSVELLQGDSSVDSHDGNEESQRLMQIVLRETDRLNGLISEFLNYVRPEKLRRVRVDLQALIDETVETLQDRAALSEVTFQVVRDEEDAPDVAGDPEKLRQVLYNLLLNAADAMPSGGAVTVHLRKIGGEVQLEVRDTGTGIPPDELDRVFDPFFTTKDSGTGLGLAITHKIVDAHRGYIEVDSEPESGTTFRIVLPAWVPGTPEVHFDVDTRG